MRKLWFWLASFIFYGFLGWVLEAVYLTVIGDPIIQGTFYPWPFKPTYAFGCLLIVALEPFMRRWPVIAQWFAFSIALGSYEVLAGAVSYHVEGRQLWDYSANILNIYGYTDAAHATLWGLLSLFVIYVLHPRLKELMRVR